MFTVYQKKWRFRIIGRLTTETRTIHLKMKVQDLKEFSALKFVFLRPMKLKRLYKQMKIITRTRILQNK